ncbi:MAG: hypothetical protein U0793_19940 [Gemmataceae bacterium]
MEAMALESLVGSVWRLDGFLSVTRVPLRVEGGYSDVDVVGVRGDGAVRIAECKARGPARQVFVEAERPQWSTWWDDSFANVPRLWEQRPDWLPSPSQVTSVEYHLVGNVWFTNPKVRSESEARLVTAISAILPAALKGKLRAIVTPSIDLVFEAIRRVREEVVDKAWGKRYGDPLLDALRELIRYAHPRPSGGGKVAATIREKACQDLFRAVFDQAAGSTAPSKKFHKLTEESEGPRQNSPPEAAGESSSLPGTDT